MDTTQSLLRVIIRSYITQAINEVGAWTPKQPGKIPVKPLLGKHHGFKKKGDSDNDDDKNDIDDDDKNDDNDDDI